MLTMTKAAARIVTTTREREGLDEEFGLRVFAQEGGGGPAVQLAFAREPAAGDAVAESEGQRLFVAEELVEPLADAVLDATPEGSSLVLKQPGER